MHPSACGKGIARKWLSLAGRLLQGCPHELIERCLGPQFGLGLADRGGGFGGAEAEVEQSRDSVLGVAAGGNRRAAGRGAEGDAAGLVLELVDDALGEFRADAL